MTNAYKISILYYTIFSILLFVSAYMLFEYKIGFTFESIVDYYVGNQERFLPAKSIEGLLKVTLPHIFVFGLLAMVLTHFLIFTNLRFTKKLIVLISALFITIFFEIFAPFMIISGFKYFAYIKLVSFFVFLALLLYICFLLFKTISELPKP